MSPLPPTPDLPAFLDDGPEPPPVALRPTEPAPTVPPDSPAAAGLGAVGPATFRTHHDRAMALVERSLLERRTAGRDERRAWLNEALDLEIAAAQLTPDPEWRAVLYESAAVIARKVGRSRDARSLARKAQRWAQRAQDAAEQKSWWTRWRADWQRLFGHRSR